MDTKQQSKRDFSLSLSLSLSLLVQSQPIYKIILYNLTHTKRLPKNDFHLLNKQLILI